MRKKAALTAVCLILTTAFILSFSACDPVNPGTLFSDEYWDILSGRSSFTAETIDDLRGCSTVRQIGSALEGARYDSDSGDTTYIGWTPSGGVFYEGEQRLNTLGSGLWYTYVRSTVEGVSSYTATIYSAQGEFTSYQMGATFVPPTLTAGKVVLPDGRMIQVDDKGVPSFSEPSLDEVGDRAAFGDYFLEEKGSDVYAVYDKDGEFVRLFAMSEIIDPGASGSATYLMLDGRIGVQVRTTLLDDAGDYDYSIGTTKYALDTYFYDVSNGKLSEKKDFRYVFSATSGINPAAGPAMIVSVREITDSKTLSDQILQTFDKDLNVYLDIQEMFPGATSIDFEGGYLSLSGGGIVRLYDREGELVSEYAADSRVMSASGLFVVGGMYYFDAEGNKVFELNANRTHIAQVPGYIYFEETSEDDPVGQLKVYNVAQGNVTSICAADDYAINDSFLYFMSGNDVVFRALSDPDSNMLSITTASAEISDVDVSELSSGFGKWLVSYSASQSGSDVSVSAYAYIEEVRSELL